MARKIHLRSLIQNSKLQQFFYQFWLPVLYIVFVLAVIPVKHTFEFDSDEGINLIKALLYSRGFSLYTQIWSDQPPLYTIFLSWWFHLFGQTVFVGRLLTLLFSAVLLWAFYQTVRSYLGNLLASVATLLLISTSQFIQLSVSVMIGFPSLSLAMLSIYCLTLYKQKHQLYLLLVSSCLFTLSLQIKIFTIFLIPILILYILDFKILERNLDQFNVKLFRPILFWIGTIFCFYILIGSVTYSINYEQIIQPHIGHTPKNIQEIYGTFGNLDTLGKRLIHIITVLGILGISEVLVNKRREGVFPLVWLLSAGILLLNHRPIWYHHFHLLSIPLSWLSAYGVDLLIRFFKLKELLHKFRLFYINKLVIYNLIVSVSLLLILSVAYIKYHKTIESDIVVRQQKYYQQFEVVHLISKYKNSTRWVFTDRPIYTFYANLPIPPEIAMLSIKRFATGNITEVDILNFLQKYRPEQILLSRFRDRLITSEQIQKYLNKNYEKVYEKNSFFYKDLESFYVLKSLL